MFTLEQRFDYSGGVIKNLTKRVFRLQKDTDHTWFELLEKFLEQPNVNEVEAISIGWWQDQIPEFDGLPAVLEAVIASREKLPNLRFLYVLDIDQDADIETFFDSFTEYPSISASALLSAFPKLEFLGIFACWIEDLQGLSSTSLRAIEWRVPYTLDLYNNMPYEKPQVLAQLAQSHLPNLETIALEVNPLTDYNAAVKDLRKNNPFPKLSSVLCPNPIPADDDDENNDGSEVQYVDLEMRIHTLIASDKKLSFFSSARIDLIGE